MERTPLLAGTRLVDIARNVRDPRCRSGQIWTHGRLGEMHEGTLGFASCWHIRLKLIRPEEDSSVPAVHTAYADYYSHRTLIDTSGQDPRDRDGRRVGEVEPRRIVERLGGNVTIGDWETSNDGGEYCRD